MTRIEVTISDDLAKVLVDALTKLNKYIKIDIDDDEDESDDHSEEVKPSSPINRCINEERVAPSLDEITSYCNEKKYRDFNAQRFFSYYSNRNWVTKNGADLLVENGWKRTVDSWMVNGVVSSTTQPAVSQAIPSSKPRFMPTIE